MRLLPPIADRRLLDEGRGAKAMRPILAVMLFLTVLAAALGLGVAGARALLDRQLAGRLTVQVVQADAARRDAQARAAAAALAARPEVRKVAVVDPARLAALLQPWLGGDGLDGDLPMPALIDVDLADANGVAAVERAARAVAPDARVDAHARWLSPVSGFMRTLSWFALALVAMMAAATSAIVFLAARAGLDTHRDTIEVLHMLGSTDVQVARLFQRRIAIDALVGGLAGAVPALGAVALLGSEIGALGSDLLSGIGLAPGDWLLLALLPFGFALLAAAAARAAVLGVLRQVL